MLNKKSSDSLTRKVEPEPPKEEEEKDEFLSSIHSVVPIDDGTFPKGRALEYI